MCGIYGSFGGKGNFDKIKHRGKDGIGQIADNEKILFHTLHAIVGKVKQPLTKENSTFMSNCEIYNWKKLNEKYALNAKNDAELLFFLLEKKGLSALDELDGVYAFYWEKQGVVYLVRDILGVKPLCYTDDFAFASEGKALEGDVKELDPRKILKYDVKSKKISFIDRSFFTINQNNDNKKNILKELEVKLVEAVQKRTAGLDHFGILFSGGIDSTILAFICKKLGKKFTCYTAAFADGNTRIAPDLISAKEVASELGFELKHVELGLEKTEKTVKEVITIIETRDPIKVGVGLPFFICSKMAAEDGCKVLFSGLGSEEIFAGYKRHLDVFSNGGDVNKECLNGLKLMHERDLYRDDLVTMANAVELRLPFLDHCLVDFSLGIPSAFKIDNTHNKKILRELAIKMGVLSEIAMQKKRAAQYGSNFDKALEKLAGKNGKREYLNSLN